MIGGARVRRRDGALRFIRCAALALLLACLPSFALALEPPARPSGRVSDYANVLSSVDAHDLEARLARNEQMTSRQIAIAIFPSLEGGSLEDFSLRLATQWKIGQRGVDNGILIVVFTEDRAARIEVGYGLEGVIPDVIASRIIREEMGPRFAEQNYAGGLRAAVDAIIARTDGSDTSTGAPIDARSRKSELSPFAMLVLSAIVIFLLMIDWFFLGGAITRALIYASMSRGSWSSGGGGGFSGGGGSFGGGGASGRW